MSSHNQTKNQADFASGSLANHVFGFLQSNNLLGRPLVVALSGGLDSMVMLSVMLEIRRSIDQDINLSAIHVNHGLSSNAKDWQSFVTRFCQFNQVELQAETLSLKKQSQHSLEQQARDARYKAIAELAPSQAVVLTGHHQQDQFETFLLRLSRGAGVNGLGAMRELTKLPVESYSEKGIRLARPLLPYSQNFLVEYATDNNLEWVEDESNQNVEFDRNFIRHRITPAYIQRWPHFIDAVYKSTQHLQEEGDLLAEYLNQDLAPLIVTQSFGQLEEVDGAQTHLFQFRGLDLQALFDLPQVKQRPLIRLFVNQVTGNPPTSKGLEQLMTSVIEAKKDKQPELLLNGFTVRRFKETLFLVSEQELTTRKEQLAKRLTIKGVESEELKLVFDHTKLTLQPNANSGTKKISQLLKQKGCPAWLRAFVPVYLNGIDVVSVVGYATDINYQSQVSIRLT